MPKFEFQVPKLSGDINKDIKGLFNAYIDMSQNFQWLLTNLNETNVKRAKSVVADWVYAGEVKTDQLIAGEAMIDTALIEELIVGTNVDRGIAPMVFYTTPIPPYKVNDIWIDGSDLKRCKTARESGTYVAGDWELGTNYTNPSGVTSIIGGVVTTDYVNALNVTAYSVNAEWVYAGNIETDQIVAGEAKIGTALIEDLVVGDNVTMGEDASISWSQVTGKPSIPDEYTDADALQAWANSGYATYIDSNGVYTGTLAARHAIISNGAGTGSLNINLGTSEYTSFKGAYTTSGNTLMVGRSTTPGGSVYTMERIDMMAGTLYVYNHLYVNTSASINGKTVATLEDIPSLSGYAKESWVSSNFVADGTDSYVHSESNDDISIAVTESGIVIRKDGTVLGSIFYD
jgi:hypothetical protein